MNSCWDFLGISLNLGSGAAPGLIPLGKFLEMVGNFGEFEAAPGWISMGNS